MTSLRPFTSLLNPHKSLLRALPRTFHSSASTFSQFDLYQTDAEDVMFPRETKGLDYSFNWNLAHHMITPRDSAYRNPDLRTLIQHSGPPDCKLAKTKTNDKVLQSSLSTDQAVAGFYSSELSQEKPVGGISMEPLHFLDFDEFKDETRDYLSTGPSALFVQDAALGSTRFIESSNTCYTRCVTDSPSVALFNKNMLVKVKPWATDASTQVVHGALLDKEAGEGQLVHADVPIRVYCATTMDSTPMIGFGIKADVLTDKPVASVVIRGAVPFPVIQETIATAAAHLLLQPLVAHEEAVQEYEATKDKELEEGESAPVHPGDLELDAFPLACNVSSSGDLTFDKAAYAPTTADATYSAHNAIWTSQGITNLWGGLHTKNEAGGALLTSDGAYVDFEASSNLLPHPSSIVLNGGKVDTATFAKEFSLTGNILEAKYFEKLMKQHAVKVSTTTSKAAPKTTPKGKETKTKATKSKKK